MKILGIDYGEKRIGLALADSELTLAVPLEIIENKGTNFVLDKLSEICQKEEIEKIVTGMPITLAGGESEKTREVKRFVDQLKNKLDIDIETEDERLSTKMVDSLAKDKRKPKDAVSAMIILQSYLDKHVNL